MSTDDKDEPRTIFQPSVSSPPDKTSVSTPLGPSSSSPTIDPGSVPRSEARIKPGDVLNHMFEVKRFIARGGMGEVFEGINISSEERVAIKVMLPAFAADPNVQAMFRKEARTLTRLGHPALVQYRVLAQEPQLGVLYIVTEYIDGANLSDVLRELNPPPSEIRTLARRLADGLRAAHGLGAIHRDISPDNVLLEDGRLDRAKIIDFGIAKDLDPSTKTIVGDGFAGKLNYVAPEQLGDFGRDVGPWSDVYSLGLVLLAIVLRRDVDMGATLVDAVDRRRQGPDLSAVPPELRPVIAKMLVANPAERFRSMDEVIAALDGAVLTPLSTPDTSISQPPSQKAKGAGRRVALMGGAAIAVLVLAGGGAYILLGKSATRPMPSAAIAPFEAPALRARRAVQAILPTIKCSWLTIDRVGGNGGAVALTISGVAHDPATAQGAISHALASAGLSGSSINFDNVLPVESSVCEPLDAFRAIRSTATTGISVKQSKFELSRQPDHEMGANVVIDLDIGSEGSGFGLYGLEPSGTTEAVADSRASFLQNVAAFRGQFTKTGPTQYRASLSTSHAGLSGLIRLTGREPFDTKLITTPAAERAPDWAARIADEAAAGGWKAQIIWYRTVDEVPG